MIVAVGLLGPLLALLPGRFAPPIVIGEIAAGVAIGHTGTGTLDPTQPTLVFLADIGFALLMFIVGTHIPIREKHLLAAARRGVIATVVTIVLAAVLAPLVATIVSLHRPAIVAVLVATSSAAVVLPIVENHLEGDCLVLLFWVSAIDIVTVLAVPLVLASGGVARALLGSLLVIAGAAAIGAAAWRVRGADATERLRNASQEHGFALDLRVSLLALFTLAWVAERFDTTVLIAGFAAGVMVAALGPPRRVARAADRSGRGFLRAIVLRRAGRAARPARPRTLARRHAPAGTARGRGRAGARRRRARHAPADGVRPPRERAARRAVGRRRDRAVDGRATTGPSVGDRRRRRRHAARRDGRGNEVGLLAGPDANTSRSEPGR